MTFVIQRYPVHLIDVVSLAADRRATIRPSLPQDAEAQMEFFRALSPLSRYHRFMTRFSEPPAGLIARFASTDYRNHLALLAEDRQRRVVGEARYVGDQDEPGTCKLAIAVADTWQRLGLGRVEQHVRAGDRHQRGFTSATSFVIDSFASPNSITVFGL